MTIPVISAGVVALFLILAGINAIRTRHFAEGIVDGTPAVTLGVISLGFGLVMLAGIVYFVATYRGT